MFELLDAAKAFIEPIIRPDSVLCDFTMGNGHDTEYLCKKVPDGKVYAFDIQESALVNTRKRLDEETLGVKVISIGVPTVVDGATLAHDLIDREKSADYSVLPESEEMMVTPKEIDLLVERASKLVGLAINCALQKGLSPEEIMSLVS